MTHNRSFILANCLLTDYRACSCYRDIPGHPFHLHLTHFIPKRKRWNGFFHIYLTWDACTLKDVMCKPFVATITQRAILLLTAPH